MSNNNTIVYIGDFDFRNENVQSHLVKNNAKLLNKIGYDVCFIGIDRTNSDCKSLQTAESIDGYLELPNTLNVVGWFKRKSVCKKIIDQLETFAQEKKVSHVITYQSPTYAVALKKIARWCKKNGVAYIVNCADLPIFSSQPFVRRMVMKWNWSRIHYYNKKYADGIISVSRFIDGFYKKRGCPSVIIPPLFDETALLGRSSEVNDIPVFLYAGTPFPLSGCKVCVKGMKDRLDLIIDLMLKLEEERVPFRFDIIGISLHDYCVSVPRHCKKVEQSNGIHFYGPLSHEGVVERLASADYTINYRDKNRMTCAGMSTKVVESVSVGIPVVMNDVGDTFLYLEEGLSGIKLTGTFSKDVETLVSLTHRSKEEREENKNRIRSDRVFSVDRFVPVMQEFLERIH